MQKLEKIAEQIRQTFDAQTATRDKALGQARALTPRLRPVDPGCAPG